MSDSAWHWVHGLLVLTFVLHCVAFTVLAIRRRKSYYFFLTGTFVFLTALYIMKFLSLSPTVGGTGVELRLVLRIGAIACTATYLIVLARTPGSWFSRLLGRG